MLDRASDDLLGQEVRDEEAAEFLEKAKDAMKRVIKELDEGIEEKTLNTVSRAINAENTALQWLLKLQSREFQVNRQQSQQSQRSQGSSQNRMQRMLDDMRIRNFSPWQR